MSIPSLKNFHKERIMASLRVAVISLGCVRNTVDSESIIGAVTRKGHVLADETAADAVIVNTCGFIEAAKKESIAVISDLVRLKKEGRIRFIIVAGCLAQRYADDLRQGFPEVDAIVGVLSLNKEARQAAPSISPKFSVYLKICESCYNHCSFCAIPRIKGKFVSRSPEAILDDVRRLDGRGVREINVVGQDVTAYGMDLTQEKMLAFLLKEMCKAAGHIDWIRLLYTFPAHVTDELIDVIADSPKICKYIDMPLQHINDRMLTLMRRNITRAQTETLLDKLRARIQGVSLRTTFIVGFPGETDAEFEELLAFIKERPFERAGAFIYSKEEGTAAFHLKGHVASTLRKERLSRLMRVQESLAANLQEAMVGRNLKVLIEKEESAGQTSSPGVAGSRLFVGRSEYDAPDVDGCVYVNSAVKLEPGVFVDVKISAAIGHDLQGEMA